MVDFVCEDSSKYMPTFDEIWRIEPTSVRVGKIFVATEDKPTLLPLGECEKCLFKVINGVYCFSF